MSLAKYNFYNEEKKLTFSLLATVSFYPMKFWWWSRMTNIDQHMHRFERGWFQLLSTFTIEYYWKLIIDDDFLLLFYFLCWILLNVDDDFLLLRANGSVTVNISSVAVEEASYENMKYMTKTITKIEMWKYEFKGVMQIIAKKIWKAAAGSKRRDCCVQRRVKSKRGELSFFILSPSIVRRFFASY